MTRQVFDDAAAVSVHGVITAAHPIAADIGAAQLRDGATIFDAVVAAALAETVLLPPKCGLAGDVVALVFRAGRSDPEALISVGAAPRRLPAACMETSLPPVGGLSVGLPGAPAGYRAVAALGNRPLTELAAPAIALARGGFEWSAVCAYLTEQSIPVLREQNPNGVQYLPGGMPWAAGTRVTMPGLATVLEAFVGSDTGPFDGEIGDAVFEAVRDRGGVIDRDELTQVQAQWSSPARLQSVSGTTLWATPMPTHGPSLLEAVANLPCGSSPAVLMKSVEESVLRRSREAGDMPTGGGTSVVTAADHAGNAVVLLHSNSFQRYGSGIIVEPYGLVVSNRVGRGYSATPGHPNFPALGRRPVTTLHAWAASMPGFVIAGATPGGENQMRWNSQTLASILHGEYDPATLCSEPRWGRFRGRLTVEQNYTSGRIADLETACGSEGLDLVPALSLRSAQQVIRFSTNGQPLKAGADPRTGAAARGI
ncbi:gamma-glutamyltransferase [Rhodococcus rhodochrous]|uniref:gamma-glutamyltransferase n=1 Tax=Rhodococcus rhodochrous TaxID=1829 RepID=UPI0032DF15EB